MGAANNIKLYEEKNMLSYRKWKTLNESFAGPITLGVANPTNLGAVGNLLHDLEEVKKMAAKKSKKKMGDDEEEDWDDEGDGEIVEPTAKKDDPDVDVDVDTDDDEGGEEGGCTGKFCGKKSKKKSAKNMKKSKKKMAADEDDVPMDDDEPLDDEGEDDDVDLEVDPDDEEMDMGDEEAGPEGGCTGGPKFCGKKSKKKSSKNMKKEGTEEDQWWASVRSQLDGEVNRKFGDGWSEYHEDALLPPDDPNSQVVSNDEPGPGEVGYAPQGKVGSWFGQ